MKINAIKTQISFGRELTSPEMREYKQVLKEGKQLAGQTGKSVFIMPSACLPQAADLNTGAGSLASDYAQDYLSYMRDYLGFNMVEDLPAGHVTPRNGFYCAYKADAFTLGNHQINPELLTTERFGKILTMDEVRDIADCNRIPEKEKYVNFPNVMDHYGAQNKALRKAFDRFKKLDEDSELRKKFEVYKKENAEWLDIPREQERYPEFFKFKQFIADEHLQIAREKLNEKGMKLCGDCLIGFSPEEVAAFPKAFKPDHYIGLPDWHLSALDFDKITDPTSDAYKLLKMKVQLFARRYDAIRFDVGWAYITPVITPANVNKVLDENKKEMGSSVLELIEGWVKEVQGEKFDKKNMLYEVEASGDVFRAFNNDGSLIEPLRDRVKIYSSTYMHGDDGYGSWGHNQAYLDRGWKKEEFMLGVGNHDPQPLRQIAMGQQEEIKVPGGVRFEEHKKPAIPVLSKTLGIEERRLIIPAEFAKAKWADPMMAHNNHMFYMDVFGREERFDMQGFNTYCCPNHNYAYKVPSDYRTAYQEAIREGSGLFYGFGFNPMDALEKVFNAKGLAKKHPELFAKIQKFRKILASDEPMPEVIAELLPSPMKTKDVSSLVSDAVKTQAENITVAKISGGSKLLRNTGMIGAGLAALGAAFGYKFVKNPKENIEVPQVASVEKQAPTVPTVKSDVFDKNFSLLNLPKKQS